MYKQVDDEFRAICIQKNGSFLKTCRSSGGGGAVLIAVAGMLLAVIAAFAVIGIVTLNNGDSLFSAGAAVFGAVAAALFILLIILGFIMKKNRKEQYIGYYQKTTGCSQKQLEEFDREVAEPSTCYLLRKDQTLKKLSKAQVSFFADGTFIITRNWIKLSSYDILRLMDLAAIFYEDKAYYRGEKWSYVLFTITCDGKVSHYGFQSKKEVEEYMPIIDLVKSRNPATVTSRIIEVQGQELDCLKQPHEIAQLYSHMVKN